LVGAKKVGDPVGEGVDVVNGIPSLPLYTLRSPPELLPLLPSLEIAPTATLEPSLLFAALLHFL
jgi:hypothetical protein